MHKFEQYIEMENETGLSVKEFSIFGDRVPSGYTKVRLFQKYRNQVYWVLKTTVNDDGTKNK